MKFNLERYPNNKNPSAILTPRKDIAWECDAVFNPSVIFDNSIFHMLYRTYPKLEIIEPKYKKPGYRYKNRRSLIGYAHSTDGIHFERRELPALMPSEPYDSYACEDPRVTKIDDTFYITYTAIDGELDLTEKPNVRIALATTKDFITFKKHGTIGPSHQSKAATLFPEPILGNKLGLLLTLSADSTNSQIILRTFDKMSELLTTNFENWNSFLAQARPVLKTESWFHRGPEVGAIPIKTDEGWLIIFSCESMSDSWTIGAALLDLKDPQKVLARSTGYLLQPVTDYERDGIVPNVTFPEGSVVVGDALYVYYGCADTVTGLCDLQPQRAVKKS